MFPETGELELLEQVELLLADQILNLTNESPMADFETIIKSLNLKSKGYINKSHPLTIPLIGEAWHLFGVGTELETNDIEALFIADDLSVTIRLLLSLSERRKKNLTIIGTARWDSQSDLSRSEQALDGIVFVRGVDRASADPVNTRFFDAYKNAYSEDADFMAAQAFDVGTMLAASLAQETGKGDITQVVKKISS